MPSIKFQEKAHSLTTGGQQRWARIRTETNFFRIRSGLDCNFFEKWQIRTWSDWENFCCFNVIILIISKILVVIRYHRFAKWQRWADYEILQSESSPDPIKLNPTQCWSAKFLKIISPIQSWSAHAKLCIFILPHEAKALLQLFCL